MRQMLVGIVGTYKKQEKLTYLGQLFWNLVRLIGGQYLHHNLEQNTFYIDKMSQFVEQEFHLDEIVLGHFFFFVTFHAQESCLFEIFLRYIYPHNYSGSAWIICQSFSPI